MNDDPKLNGIGWLQGDSPGGNFAGKSDSGKFIDSQSGLPAPYEEEKRGNILPFWQSLADALT
jgi:hypothetical protein